jgi:hypothetical protein
MLLTRRRLGNECIWLGQCRLYALFHALAWGFTATWHSKHDTPIIETATNPTSANSFSKLYSVIKEEASSQPGISVKTA